MQVLHGALIMGLSRWVTQSHLKPLLRHGGRVRFGIRLGKVMTNKELSDNEAMMLFFEVFDVPFYMAKDKALRDSAIKLMKDLEKAINEQHNTVCGNFNHIS